MIRQEQHDRVTVLTIDRHEQRNALDVAHATDLLTSFDAAVEAGARVIVLTGAGSSFCAGADLSTVHDLGFRKVLYRLIHRIAEAPLPVIAAINGPAIGAGSQLAIASDLRVAARTARFGVPAARLGVATDLWTVQRLTAVAGGGVARALLLGADAISAERAHNLGLVDRIGEPADALAWAEEIAALAPMSLAYFKQALNVADTGATVPLATQDALQAAELACWQSQDLAEAAQARREGRPAVFAGK